MNSGDVFILDAEESIYQWNGASSNAHERQQAMQFCQSLRGEVGGKKHIVTLTEGQVHNLAASPCASPV